MKLSCLWRVICILGFAPILVLAQASKVREVDVAQQAGQPGDPVTLKNWPAPLYFQKSQAETELRAVSNATGSPQLAPQPKLQFPGAFSADALIFVAMTPCRLADTRSTSVPQYPALGLSPLTGIADPKTLTLALAGGCGQKVASFAEAYSLNITVVPVSPTIGGYLLAYPGPLTPVPSSTATMTWNPSASYQTNAVITAASAGGSFNVVASQNTNIVIDINGYYAAPTDPGTTALGFQSLQSNTTGTDNTAVGSQSLQSNTTANNNTAIGNQSLQYNTGSDNTAVGNLSGNSNTTGQWNTFVGEEAGNANTTGSYGAFFGFRSGYHNNGDSNSFFGYQAGFENTGGTPAGTGNSFFGRSSGFNSGNGINNTCLGFLACYNVGSGSHNTYVGVSAGSNATNSGSYNVYLGDSSGLNNPGGSSNVYLGNPDTNSIPLESNTIRIGTLAVGSPAPAGSQNTVFIEPILANKTSLSNVVTIDPITGRLGQNTLSLSGGGLLGSLTNCPGGPTNFVTKWANSTTVECSQIYDTGDPSSFAGNVGIGTTTFTAPLAKTEISEVNLAPGASQLRLTNPSMSSTGTLLTEAGLMFSPGINGINYDAGRIYAKYVNQNALGNPGRVTIQSVDTASPSHLVDTLSVYAGNVGIGTIAPAYALHTVIGTAGVVARFTNTSGTCDINPTTTTLVCSSDERLKKNITSMDDDLTRIMALRPVQFNWSAESAGTPGHPGFIAQQVQQVMPEVVSTDPATGLLSIGYSELVPAVVSAMHQMQAEITTLQGSVTGSGESSHFQPAGYHYEQAQIVQYDKLVPILVNEMQKQDLQIRKQAEAIQRQQEQNRKLEARLAALEALLSSK
jgi:hypothetical protein